MHLEKSAFHDALNHQKVAVKVRVDRTACQIIEFRVEHACVWIPMNSEI